MSGALSTIFAIVLSVLIIVSTATNEINRATSLTRKAWDHLTIKKRADRRDATLNSYDLLSH